MAEDIKNKDGTGTGDVSNGRVTVRGNRNNFKHLDASSGNVNYTISKFDNSASVSSDLTDGAKLSDRIDDPRYYNGDDPS